MNNRIISTGRLKTLFGISDSLIAASYNTLCPTKSLINLYRTTLGLVGQITNSSNYVDNQLIKEGDVMRWVTTPIFDDVPARGGNTSLSNNPKIRCYFTEGNYIETSYPSTTYGTWTVTNVSASNLITTVKARTQLTTLATVKFTASSTYGGGSISYSSIVYQAANEITNYEEEFNLNYPDISYSCHADLSGINEYSMGYSDCDPHYRLNGIPALSFTSIITKLIFTSGSYVTPSTTYLSNYNLSYKVSNTTRFVTSNTYILNLLQNNMLSGFTFTTSSPTGYKLRILNENTLALYTTLGNTDSIKTFNINVSVNNNVSELLKSRVTIKANGKPNNSSTYVLQHDLSSTLLSKQFELKNYGIITLNNTTSGYDYILFKSLIESSTIYVYTNSSEMLQSPTDEYGVIGRAVSNTLKVPNYERTALVESVYTNTWAPKLCDSSYEGTVRVLRLKPKSGSNSYREAFDPYTLGSYGEQLLGTLECNNEKIWFPRADYTVDVTIST